MGNFNSENTKKLLDATTKKVSMNIDCLMRSRDSALSEFRLAANRLQCINDQMGEQIANMEVLESFIKDKKDVVNQAIHDNDAVRARILDIIGE